MKKVDHPNVRFFWAFGPKGWEEDLQKFQNFVQIPRTNYGSYYSCEIPIYSKVGAIDASAALASFAPICVVCTFGTVCTIYLFT